MIWEGNKDHDFIEAPWWGVPPPLVFEVGRCVARKEVLKECVVNLGVFPGMGWGPGFSFSWRTFGP